MLLTDARWARMESLLPDRMPKRGGRWRDRRQMFDAVAFEYRTGTPLMDLPECFGSWKAPITGCESGLPMGRGRRS
ncbi:transposase [Streptomyces sp. NPDC096095]|uniref:transposase n=1 Tax=Streptomyces sp. NPDC096095 TaxID=3155545 RepID=UPI0033174D8B